MTENSESYNQLIDKLETLLKKQEIFAGEINELKAEIKKLRIIETEQVVFENEPEQSSFEPATEIQPEIISLPFIDKPELTPIATVRPKTTFPPSNSRNLEKFVGENLINKIGIIITVIGVAIGAKYSIDHELISPLARIILGYIAGLLLFGFGLKLKAKYESYSAVLVSGAMAIMYFITYFAYSFYNLMPQSAAFALMVFFTVVTVVAAIKYNMQVIAHIGLVGAYTVPFLLSDGSGKVLVLFSYMAIINTGILVIAFRKYWKPIYYSSFLLTWLIYFVWYTFQYKAEAHFEIALAFLTVFFLTFYATFLAYKVIQKEKFDAGDIVLLLANSFIYFGIGYSALEYHPSGQYLLGAFSMLNALIHSIVAFVIYKQKLADRNLGYLVTGLALVFISIAIPVQLDGNWVTLLWVGEAALLFWIGRTRNVSFYETISYPLMIFAFFSLMLDWKDASFSSFHTFNQIPFINISFFSSMLFVAAFFFISMLSRNLKYSPVVTQMDLTKIMSFIIPGILLIALYYSFGLEIANYWDQLYSDSEITKSVAGKLTPDQVYNEDLLKYKSIWLINYSLMFLSILSFVNFKWIKNQMFALLILVFSTLAIVVFLSLGLFQLSELRESYLSHSIVNNYQSGIFNIWIRYISLTFAALVMIASYIFIYRKSLENDHKLAAELVFHLFVVWVASSELISWMDMAGSTHSYKLGLSILWGLYALLLIVVGIWKRKKYLRIGAIVLFTGTLVKLFFYDISYLDTIAKTIVFVSLGVLLLIISFLYNKYKHIISD